MRVVRLGELTNVSWGNTSITKASYVPLGVVAYSAAGPDGYLSHAEHRGTGLVVSAIGSVGDVYFAEGEWTAIKNTITITPREGVEVDFRFLFHYLSRRGTWYARGGTQQFIGLGTAKDVRVVLPPLTEQRRIAEILDKADALRAKRRAALAQLDTLTQSIFLDMFGDPATNPKGWPKRRLQDVVKEGTIVTYGIVQAGEEHPGGIPYVRTGDIVDGKIVLDELRHTDPEIASKFGRSRVETGDIVMSIRATVGTTALVPPDLNGANLTQGTARISPGNTVDRRYLLHFLRAPGAQHWISLQIKGATFREITLARLRELPVAVPSIDIQREFARRATAAEDLRATHDVSLSELNALVASLQNCAFRGEL